MRSFDLMVQRFMRQHEVPGLALAVTDHGRLIYARGFGYADVEKGEPVRPTSLFRIASLTKPITAVAVLQLVQQGKIRLDDSVLELLGYNASSSKAVFADQRFWKVTVQHLLQHRGGWDRNVSGDPMFQSVRIARAMGVNPPARPDAIIRYMAGRPLDFEPGQRYAYSNFGYCLLGRIIERVTGQSYEDYVRRYVLEPLGIHSMRLGKTRPADRAPGEVKYYHPGCGPSVFADNLGKPVPWPYGAWCLEAMDAHGGWIASVIDLARFACDFDNPTRSKLLPPAGVRTLFARPPGLAGYAADGTPKKVYYSCGWLNRVVAPGRFNRWHNGRLDGSSSLLVRRHDGRNWVVLMNGSTGRGGEPLDRLIDPLLHQAARRRS